MNLVTFIMLGSVMSTGIYLILGARKSEVLVGVTLFSQAINLLLIEACPLGKDRTDPLAQALVLTAIVIGFASISFLAAFLFKRHRDRGNEELP